MWKTSCTPTWTTVLEHQEGKSCFELRWLQNMLFNGNNCSGIHGNKDSCEHGHWFCSWTYAQVALRLENSSHSTQSDSIIYFQYQLVANLHCRYRIPPLGETFKEKTSQFWWQIHSIKWKYFRCLGCHFMHISAKFTLKSTGLLWILTGIRRFCVWAMVALHSLRLYWPTNQQMSEAEEVLTWPQCLY